jgi:hypothetical protein
MEHTKIETKVLENTIAAAAEEQLRELNELQLTFVGGGIADLVAA